MTPALVQLAREEVEVKPEDVERLSPLGFKHINLHGRYSFSVPEPIMPSEQRPLHDPNELEVV